MSRPGRSAKTTKSKPVTAYRPPDPEYRFWMTTGKQAMLGEYDIFVELRAYTVHHAAYDGDKTLWSYSVKREYPNGRSDTVFGWGGADSAAQALERAFKEYYEKHVHHGPRFEDDAWRMEYLERDHLEDTAKIRWLQKRLSFFDVRTCPSCGSPARVDAPHFEKDLLWSEQHPKENPRFAVTLWWKCEENNWNTRHWLHETYCPACGEATELKFIRSENGYVLPGSTGAGAEHIKECIKCGAQVKISWGWAD